MPVAELPVALEALIARQAISEAITTVQRGIDRGDLKLLKSAWHDDAQVAYGFFNGASATGPTSWTGTSINRQRAPGPPASYHRSGVG